MSSFKPFRCAACGDQVRLVARTGRTEEYRRGVTLAVPDDFKIPTCPRCGEEYFTVALSEQLAKRQAPLYAAWQAQHCKQVVERIQKQHRVTLRQIENVCGVTGTYLSHVLAGRKEASDTLIRLLEAYALEPREFERQLGRVPWAEALGQRAMRQLRPPVTKSGRLGMNTVGTTAVPPLPSVSLDASTKNAPRSREALAVAVRAPVQDAYTHNEKPAHRPSNDNVAA